MPPRYRVHPAIGIARVGDAPAADMFIGPERPGQPGPATYKSGGRIRRQAARFRVYEYVESGGRYTLSREILPSDGDVLSMEWVVHVANLKAAFVEFGGLAGSPLVPPVPPKLRNSGARRRGLHIDPLARTISARSRGPVPISMRTPRVGRERWPVPQPTPPITSLGELRTDADGRLLVIGGAGIAASRGGAAITHYANNDGWFDDVCDGPIHVRLRLRRANGRPETVAVAGAWVVVAPPDFAPGLPPTVSLYDMLYDLAAREIPIPADETAYDSGDLDRLKSVAADLRGGGIALTAHKVSFDHEVAPILRQAMAVRWVIAQAAAAHSSFGAGSTDPPALWPHLADPSGDPAVRKQVFERLRKPGTTGPSPTNMPRLLGDDPYPPPRGSGTTLKGLSLTVTQYAILEQWAKGNFLASALPPSSLYTVPVAPSVTPHGLDRAALERCSGGPFFPGIEVGWQIRAAALFSEPFRIAYIAPGARAAPGARRACSVHAYDRSTPIGAGYLTRQMAVPWQADFLMCQEERSITGERWGWWPTQRPIDVVDGTGATVKWHRADNAGSPDWPPDPGRPRPRRADHPSYAQMVANWAKFGFVTGDFAVGFTETERNGGPIR